MKRARKRSPRVSTTILSKEGNRDKPIGSEVGLYILESGRGALEMDRVSNNGLMEQSTLVSGRKIGLMVEESSSTLMVMYMKVTGPMTKQTVSVPIAT